MRAYINQLKDPFWVIFIYIIFSVVMGFDAISEGWSVALSLWGASFSSLLAGQGLRSSFYAGFKPIIMGLSLAGAFMVLAQWLGTMYSVGIFGNQLSGQTWSLIGFIIGFFFTTKKLATSDTLRNP